MAAAIYIIGDLVEVRSASAGGRVLLRVAFTDDASKAAAIAAARVVADDADRRERAQKRLARKARIGGA